jgi:hypothetical protein
LLLDPERFGESSYSKNELIAGTNRLFFYLELKDKEDYFDRSPLYKREVPATKIYNILKDPEGIKANIKQNNNGILNFDTMVRDISELPGIDGFYYKPNMQLVAWFRPIRVHLVDESQEMEKFQHELPVD